MSKSNAKQIENIYQPIKKQDNEEAGEQQTKAPKIDKNSNTVSNNNT